jgi:hypothetical protein
MPAVRTRPTVAKRAGLGAVAASVGLGFDWGLHRALVEVPFPPFALADRIVRVTPGPIATYMIDRLHHAAKPIVAGVCLAALIGAGAVLAVLEARWGRAAAVGFVASLLIVGLLDPVQSSFWGSGLGATVAGVSYGISLAGAQALVVARWSREHMAVDSVAVRRLGASARSCSRAVC